MKGKTVIEVNAILLWRRILVVLLQFQMNLFYILLLESVALSPADAIPGLEDFNGHKLVRIVPQDGRHTTLLLDLLVNPPTHLKGLDFWNEPSLSLSSVDVMVDPLRLHDLETFLQGQRLPYRIVVDNVQRVIDDHAIQNSARKILWRVSAYDSYLDYNELEEWLDQTASRCGPRCSLVNIGQSFEGRKLTVIKITSAKRVSSSVRRPAVWIDAGIHAREWISHSTALYFIDRLVSDYKFDTDVQGMLDSFDWYILPCVNPDGYQYSHTVNRLWRKTRSRSLDSTCVGVDANRNFPYHWGFTAGLLMLYAAVGTSTNPCSELFLGQSPLSESESAAVANFITARNGTWKLFLTLHSYGQLWMAPYGYTSNKPNNYDDLIDAANAAKNAVFNAYGSVYKVGSASDVLYRSSGTSRDWAAGVAKIPYVYTVELRDDGRNGFLLPADQIFPTGVEMWEGLKALIRQINANDDVQDILDVQLSDLLKRAAAGREMKDEMEKMSQHVVDFF